MDRIDRAIIDQLRRDGRQSNTELAAAVGLTPSPCLRRVKHLESEGIITGYHANIAPAAVDRGFEVLVEFELKEHSQAIFKRFESELISHHEVVEVRRLFGTPEYLTLIATKDLAAYEMFVSEILLELPGLSKMQTRFSMSKIKSDIPNAAATKNRQIGRGGY